MSFAEYRRLLYGDVYRYYGRMGVRVFCRAMFNHGFTYTFWMRTCSYLYAHTIWRYTLFPIAWLLRTHYEVKYGISISFRTRIGPGLCMGHFGDIVVSAQAVIGKNCDLSHGVTLGSAPRGPRKGAPQIGDNVYIGPGAKIVGGVKVGNNVAIGANCVVTKDVPDHAVVAGVPGRVISLQGSKDYVIHTEYERESDA